MLINRLSSVVKVKATENIKKHKIDEKKNRRPKSNYPWSLVVFQFVLNHLMFRALCFLPSDRRTYRQSYYKVGKTVRRWRWRRRRQQRR